MGILHSSLEINNAHNNAHKLTSRSLQYVQSTVFVL